MLTARQVPTFSRYTITEDGILHDSQRGVDMAWYITKPTKGSVGGYYMAKIMNDAGELKNIGRHRLLCLAYHGVPNDVDSLVINHKNGIPGDDRLDNIEWVTRGQNNQHAYDTGLKKDAKPVFVRNMLSGETTRYPTVEACARALGYTSGTFIYWRLNRTSEIRRYSDELMFKYDDGSDWPTIDWSNQVIYRSSVAQDYMALNVFTNEIHVFNGLTNGESLIGVDKGTIAAHVQHGRLLPINGYIVRYLTSDVAWPKFNQRILEICRDFPMKQPCGVVALDTESGEETFYTSAKKAAEAYGIKVTTLRHLITTGKLWRKKVKFSTYDIHQVIRSLQD